MSIGELEIGLASLRFRDVLIELPGTGSVRIPSATVNVSFRKLVVSGLNIQRSLGAVILGGPSVTLSYGPSDREEAEAAALDVEAVIALLPDYVGISDGAITIRDRSTGGVIAATSIDLLLERRGDGLVQGSAVGDCLGGPDNVRAELTWDGAARDLIINAELEAAQLAADTPLPSALPLAVRSGRVSATATARVPSGANGRLSVMFDIDGAVIELPGVREPLDDVAAVGRFDGDDLTLERASGTWGPSLWRAAGTLSAKEGDLRGFSVTAERVPVGPLVELLGEPAVPVAGSVDLAARIDGYVESPVARVTLSRGDVTIGRVALGDVSARAVLSADVVDVADLGAAIAGGRLAGSGRLGRDSRGRWTFDLVGGVSDLDAGDALATAGVAGAAGKLSLIDVRATGTAERPELEALVAWEDVRLPWADLGSGAGGFLFRDGGLTASLRSSDATYAVSGEVSGLPSEPAIEAEIALSSLRVDSLVLRPTGLRVPLSLDGTVRLSGPSEDLSVEGTLAARGREGGGTLRLSGGLLASPAGRRLELSLDAPDATVRGVPLPVEARIAAEGDELSVTRLDIAGVANARARVGLGSDKPLQASLVVSEAGLREVVQAITGVSLPEGVDGLVFASVFVQGTPSAPSATAQMQIGNARVGGVHGLDAALTATLSEGKVRVTEFTFRKDGSVIARASGEADLDGPLALSFKGDAVPGPLLGGGRDSEFDVTVGVGGTAAEPTVDARIEASDGEFFGIPFDKLVARITGAEGLIRLDPLALDRRGGYRMTAEGRLPYAALGGGAEYEEGYLTVEVDGDPLRLLAELTPLAESATGSGNLTVHLVGGRQGVTIASARLEARASEVRPTTLFERLNDVSAEVSVRDGGVLYGLVEGSVDGDRVRIESTRGNVVEGWPLAPLSLGGLDLGVLALSTDPGGVKASVPGLMVPGDIGKVAVRGRSGEPSLLIAGPIERPAVWGELEFSDMSFTYPFAAGSEGFGGDFLARAEWSLVMTAGRNVWYRNTDAYLKPERGGRLEFRGVPSDGTLCVTGRLESSRGTVTYVNTDFDVRNAFVEFPPFCEAPRFYVEATTRARDGTEITLTMDSIESALAFGSPGAPLDESAIRLASDSPDDNTQEEVLSKLKYGVDYELLEGEEQAALDRRRAIEVVGGQIGGRIVRPLLAPIEARVRRALKLDLVRIDVDFVEHFLAQLDQWSAQEGSAEYVPFLAESRITLGKYIAHDWMLSYVGFSETFEEDIGYQRLGLRHEVGIEYDVSRNTSLSLRAVYDPSLSGWDRRVSIENRYEF